jgi:hypothetical protein
MVNGQTQYAQTAGSYQSASDKRVHFGLGSQRSADVDIRWPSGIHQHLTNVAVDQYINVREPSK